MTAMISGEGTLLAHPPDRGVKSPICNSFLLKGERPASHRGVRREESPSQSPARPRTSKASAVRREELKCLEMVLQRSCRKEDRVAAYLRRAHHVEPAGQERIFCFDGPDDHVRRALLAQDPPWVENQMATSKIFHLKWTVSDCEDDYRYLQEGMLFNHFQRNRELTTKVGLTNNLRRFSCEAPVDVDRFFPRSYDMSSASEVQDFVLDFRRCAALGVLRQHLRLAEWAEERRRLMDHLNMDGVVDGSCYVCNVNVLRIAVKAMLHWLEDLDGTFFEDEEVPRQGGQGARAQLFTQEWDALVCYSELTDAELCGEDDGEERKRKQRGSYSASGMLLPSSSPWRSARAENHQRWPEFYQHHWGEPPEHLRQQAEETLKLLEARWPQISAQGPMNVWVVKPGSSSKGSGVLCMDSLPEVLHHCKTTSNRIVQKYIERPLLLFSGRKFDLRQWVMVRSFRPLKVYMFSSCYLRLCNEPYDLGDLENRQRHISNWSVNKRGRHVADGAVASLDEFQEVLQMMTGQRSYWEEELIPQLKSCIVQTLHAVQPNILQRSESFEVYGFDFLIGEDLKPWLLEVNLSPACESRTTWMSEMLERMASRLVEVLLQGDAFASDGREPDWQLICDEGPDVVAGSPAMSPVAPVSEELDTWNQRALNLTVSGKSVSRRFLRRLDQIWRRNEAQTTLAARWRGWALRQRMRQERWRMAGVVFHRCRQRAWQNLLRLALFQRRRGPAAKLISTVTRCFLCRTKLQEARRRKEALRIQSSWRGQRGRRRAAARRRAGAAARLQRWWRSAQLRRRLVAKGRILRWWRRLHQLRSSAAARLQAAIRSWAAARRYTLLSQHVARPTRRLALLMAAVRWRWWRMHCQVSDTALRLQRCFRGFLGRRSAKERRLLRETFGSWRMQAGPARREARLRLQRCWRGLRARRLCDARREALRTLQSALRRRLCCKQRRWRRAAVLVQRRFRGFRCSKRFRHSIRMIMVIQRGLRCWLSRRRLAMLQRFAARRRKWLNQDPQDPEPSPRVSTVLLKDEDATTQSSTPTWPESEAPEVPSSARSATDEMDISIGLIEVLEVEPEVRPGGAPRPGGIGDETFLVARNLVEAQMRREQRLGGFDEDQTSEPEVTELPLLQHLQDMARTFDALMAGVSASRCVPAAAEEVAAVASEASDLITGSALRAARRLRQQGYAKPTISSTRRTSGHDCSPRQWKGPAGPATQAPDVRDVDHLLRIAYSPPRPAGGTSRGREKTPWRLSNIEPEPWHAWDKTR